MLLNFGDFVCYWIRRTFRISWNQENSYLWINEKPNLRIYKQVSRHRIVGYLQVVQSIIAGQNVAFRQFLVQHSDVSKLFLGRDVQHYRPDCSDSEDSGLEESLRASRSDTPPPPSPQVNRIPGPPGAPIFNWQASKSSLKDRYCTIRHFGGCGGRSFRLCLKTTKQGCSSVSCWILSFADFPTCSTMKFSVTFISSLDESRVVRGFPPTSWFWPPAPLSSTPCLMALWLRQPPKLKFLM